MSFGNSIPGTESDHLVADGAGDTLGTVRRWRCGIFHPLIHVRHLHYVTTGLEMQETCLLGFVFLTRAFEEPHHLIYILLTTTDHFAMSTSTSANTNGHAQRGASRPMCCILTSTCERRLDKYFSVYTCMYGALVQMHASNERQVVVVIIPSNDLFSSTTWIS